MLLTLFSELQLEIARFLTDPSDCAALCLAVPRGLGGAQDRAARRPYCRGADRCVRRCHRSLIPATGAIAINNNRAPREGAFPPVS